jgi:ADP-heptose:LPS heptosyltransferase
MKILIIKLGAAGDVLRTTALLPGLKERYPSADITWIVLGETCKEILYRNPYIKYIFDINEFDSNQYYDLVINLDEAHVACKLASIIKKAKLIGFYVSGDKILPTETARYWYNMSLLGGIDRDNLKKANKKTYQQIIYEMVGLEYKRQKPILLLDGKGTELVKTRPIVGISTSAGERWPSKIWPLENFIQLIIKIKQNLNVDIMLFDAPDTFEKNNMIEKAAGIAVMRTGVRSIRQFAEYLNLCDFIVTGDTLHLHMGTALNKRIIALFGPTSPAEIELYDLGVKIVPNDPCVCCYKPYCKAIEKITVEDVYKQLYLLMQKEGIV